MSKRFQRTLINVIVRRISYYNKTTSPSKRFSSFSTQVLHLRCFSTLRSPHWGLLRLECNFEHKITWTRRNRFKVQAIHLKLLPIYVSCYANFKPGDERVHLATVVQRTHNVVHHKSHYYSKSRSWFGQERIYSKSDFSGGKQIALNNQALITLAKLFRRQLQETKEQQ